MSAIMRYRRVPRGRFSLYANLLGRDSSRPDVKSVFFLGYSAFGRPYIFEGQEWLFVEDEFELATRFTLFVEALLEEGKIKSHPVTVREVGWKGLCRGWRILGSARLARRSWCTSLMKRYEENEIWMRIAETCAVIQGNSAWMSCLCILGMMTFW